MLQIESVSTSCQTALRWMPQNTYHKSTLFQVMVWCCQATSHYQSQCWLNCITRPQWVKLGAMNPWVPWSSWSYWVFGPLNAWLSQPITIISKYRYNILSLSLYCYNHELFLTSSGKIQNISLFIEIIMNYFLHHPHNFIQPYCPAVLISPCHNVVMNRVSQQYLWWY